MTKKNLPLFSDPVVKVEAKKPAVKRPSIDAARKRLGGRPVASAEAGPTFAPGAIVSFGLPDGNRRVAVVVYAGSDEVHVLLDAVRLRRTAAADLAIHPGAAPDDLTKLSADAKVFGLLSESQPVRYADDSGRLRDGKLVEKCRWGALVLRDDGAIVAVGFRKLWPATTSASA